MNFTQRQVLYSKSFLRVLVPVLIIKVMKEEILSIASDLREGSMSTDQAINQLLLLLQDYYKEF